MTSYWTQFHWDEIDSMHGIEDEEHHESDCEKAEEYDKEHENVESHCVSPCLEDYMMSWRDFL
jgi:hypothetical protein